MKVSYFRDDQSIAPITAFIQDIDLVGIGIVKNKEILVSEQCHLFDRLAFVSIGINVKVFLRAMRSQPDSSFSVSGVIFSSAAGFCPFQILFPLINAQSGAWILSITRSMAALISFALSSARKMNPFPRNVI
jgi:hypothetical protein